MFNWRVIVGLLLGPSLIWAANKYIDADGIKNPQHTKTWMMPPSPGTLVVTTDNVATATALASNPSDCGANTYATTIAASGNLTCSSITNASTTGTALNTIDTLVLRDGSGNFAAGTITAALTGNASTATALAANPAACSANQFVTDIAANGDLTCAALSGAVGGFTAGSVPFANPSGYLTDDNTYLNYNSTSKVLTASNVYTDVILHSSQTTPVSPAPSIFKTYFKSDGNMYRLNNAGTENRIGGGALIVTGTRASPQAIVAGTGISYVPTAGERQLWFVEGSGGHVDITANPQIVAGTSTGQELIVICRNNDQTVTFDDGTGLSLNGQFVCGADSALGLFWDSSVWVEMYRR